MGKSEMEVVVPAISEVEIGGVKYTVKPFSIKDVVYFTRDLFEGLGSLRKKYPEIGNDANKTTLVQYIPALLDEAPRLFGLFARAVGKDGAWLEEQTDLVGVSKLFLIVVDINDFGAIISNFRQGWSKLKTQMIA